MLLPRRTFIEFFILVLELKLTAQENRDLVAFLRVALILQTGAVCTGRAVIGVANGSATSDTSRGGVVTDRATPRLQGCVIFCE